MLHLVSADQDDLIAAYREVHKEIELFGHDLALKHEVIVLSKIDLITPEECELEMQLLAKETGREVLKVSVEDDIVLKQFSDRLTKILSKQ